MIGSQTKSFLGQLDDVEFFYLEGIMRNLSTSMLFVILGPLVALGALAMDIYIPFVPGLEAEFDTSVSQVQMTLNIFMLVTAFGQLLMGPCSDRFGRRLLLLLSCVVFIIGSLGCALSCTIEQLIFFRAVQALGASGGFSVSYALVRDLYTGEESARLFSYFAALTGLAPIIGPILGTLLEILFGSWRSCFYALALFPLISLGALLIYVPDKIKNQNDVQLTQESFKDSLIAVISHHYFYSLIGVGILVMSGLFLFFSISCYYVQSTLGLDKWAYSMIFGVNACIYTTTSILAPELLKRYSFPLLLQYALIIVILAGFSLILHAYVSPLNLVWFLVSIYCCSATYGLMLGPTFALFLEPFGPRAGLASAIYGFFQFFGASVMGAFFVRGPIENGLSFALPMMSLALIQLIITLAFHQDSKNEPIENILS